MGRNEPKTTEFIQRFTLERYTALDFGDYLPADDCPEIVVTHLLGLCELLTGYIDQSEVDIPAIALLIANHPDVQNYTICLLNGVNQQQADTIRSLEIGNKKL